MTRVEGARRLAVLMERVPGSGFLLQFMAARGLISVCAFASQAVVAIRLVPADYVQYAAAYAVLLLSTEAQTLAGNLEVLAKRHAGATLGAILTNRLYFNLWVAAPALWLARGWWAGGLSDTGVLFAVVALTLSAFFPGSYGDERSLRTGLRCEAAVAAVCLGMRFVMPPSLDGLWALQCFEIIGRSLAGLALAAVGRHLRAKPHIGCARSAVQYGIILMFQMAFQRLEIAALPGIALSKFTVGLWAVGSNMLFAINAVLYQAVIGHRVVGASGLGTRSQRRLWTLCALGVASAVFLLAVGVVIRRLAPDGSTILQITLIGVYFFVVCFENFAYVHFFLTANSRAMMIVGIARLSVALVFAGMVAVGMGGLLCLAWILGGKVMAAAVQVAFLSNHAPVRLRKGANTHVQDRAFKPTTFLPTRARTGT